MRGLYTPLHIFTLTESLLCRIAESPDNDTING
jgi:hypothetical protein